MPTPTYLAIQAILQGDGVRGRLDSVADRIAARLISIQARDHLSSEAVSVGRSVGIRPRGRPYANVTPLHRSHDQAVNELSQIDLHSLGGTVDTTRQVVSGASATP